MIPQEINGIDFADIFFKNWNLKNKKTRYHSKNNNVLESVKNSIENNEGRFYTYERNNEGYW